MHEQPPAESTPVVDKARRPARDKMLRDIEHAMQKEPYDRVKCVHLFDNYFRCNWWSPTPTSPDANVAFDWATRATHYVRKSRFLHVTVSDGELVVKEAEGKSAAAGAM